MVDEVDPPVGMGWGNPCEPCPIMHSPEYDALCPHGNGVDHEGNGIAKYCKLLDFVGLVEQKWCILR